MNRVFLNLKFGWMFGEFWNMKWIVKLDYEMLKWVWNANFAWVFVLLSEEKAWTWECKLWSQKNALAWLQEKKWFANALKNG